MFTAIVLDEESEEKLRTLFYNYREEKQIPFASIGRVICHHVTLAFGVRDAGVFRFGNKVNFRASHIGTLADKVVAVKVAGVERPDHKVPHVTLATLGKGKPVHSNDIGTWEVLSEEISLSGVVTLCQ